MSTDTYNANLVERVRSFVNTFDVQTGDDQLDSPESLLGWLTGADLLDEDEVADVGPTVEAGAADVRLAHELRGTLRELLRHEHGPGAGPGAGPDPAARRRIDRLSDRLPLRVVLCSDGQPYLVPAVHGVRYGLARVLAAVAALSPDDWERLKVCPAGDCQWVFYDESRNRSRRWCSMEGCGNRSKVRSYRQRAG